VTNAIAKWYVVNNYGDAEACESEEEALQSLETFNRYERHNGPHRAVQMVEVSELTRLQGEAAVLRSLLRECDAVLAIVETENDDEAEHLARLRQQIGWAIGEAKGTLL